MNAHVTSQSNWERNIRRYYKFPKPVCTSEKPQKKCTLPVLHLFTKTPRLTASAQTSAQTTVICTRRMCGFLRGNRKPDPRNHLRLFLALVSLTANGLMIGTTLLTVSNRNKEKTPSAKNKPHRCKVHPWRTLPPPIDKSLQTDSDTTEPAA